MFTILLIQQKYCPINFRVRAKERLKRKELRHMKFKKKIEIRVLMK